jgi:hypothetical protein
MPSTLIPSGINSHVERRYKPNHMTHCSKCNARIVTHLWIVDNIIFCSPRCEREVGVRKPDHRFCDKTVKKVGVGGLVKESKNRFSD